MKNTKLIIFALFYTIILWIAVVEMHSYAFWLFLGAWIGGVLCIIADHYSPKK